jgi:hypothetical protein
MPLHRKIAEDYHRRLPHHGGQDEQSHAAYLAHAFAHDDMKAPHEGCHVVAANALQRKTPLQIGNARRVVKIGGPVMLNPE